MPVYFSSKTDLGYCFLFSKAYLADKCYKCELLTCCSVFTAQLLFFEPSHLMYTKWILGEEKKWYNKQIGGKFDGNIKSYVLFSTTFSKSNSIGS